MSSSTAVSPVISAPLRTLYTSAQKPTSATASGAGLDWKETYEGGSPEKEAAAMARRVDGLKAVIRTAAKDTGRGAERGFHTKWHQAGDCVVTIDNVPEEWRYGFFAESGDHAAQYRFSNGLLPWAGKAPDALPDVRGLAIKALRESNGELLTGEVAASQDFNATNLRPFARNGGQFLAFATATAAFATTLVNYVRAGKEKLGSFGAAAGAVLGVATGSAKMLKSYLTNPDVAETLGGRIIETARMLGTVAIGTARPISSLLKEEYEVAAIQIGPRVARLVIAPSPELKKDLKTSWKLWKKDYMRENITENRANGPLKFELFLLPYRDEKHTPLEEANRGWDTERIKVGEVTIPPLGSKEQEAEADARVNQMAFQPGHTLKRSSRKELAPDDVEGRKAQGHLPRGHIQRERLGAYTASAGMRNAAPEPTR